MFLFWGSILFLGWPHSVNLSSELQVKLEKRGVQCLLRIAVMSWWIPHIQIANPSKQFALHLQLRNWMTGRCLLCIYMMCALGIPFCLEQPSSSVMEYHPCFKFLSSRYKIFKVTWNHKSLKMRDCSICKSWFNCILIMAVTGHPSRSSFGWGLTEDTVAGLYQPLKVSLGKFGCKSLAQAQRERGFIATMRCCWRICSCHCLTPRNGAQIW